MSSREFKADIDSVVNCLAEDATPEHPLTIDMIQARLSEPNYMVHRIRPKKAGLERLTVEQLRYHSNQP